MPLNASNTRSWLPGWFIASVITVLPVVLGLPVMYWQASNTLQDEARRSLREGVRQLDTILDNAQAAARPLLPLAGQPCKDIEVSLRDQVTRSPYVRSTNLVHDAVLYCSSLYGDFNEPVHENNFVDGQLWLMNGNPVTPDSAVLVYRLSDQGNAVLAGIDGSHLRNALRLANDQASLVFSVGKHWFSGDSEVNKGSRPGFAVLATETRSGHYPYALSTGYPEGEIGRYVVREYPALVAFLLMLGLAAAIAFRRLARLTRHPGRELKRALDANEFVPYVQPVVGADTQAWAGVEVLMRWAHPTEGLVRPDLFIPMAEHTGMIVPMTRAIMTQTASALAQVAAHLPRGFHVGFNITAQHCQDLDLVQACQAFLARFAPGAVTLVLELTERELIVPTPTTTTLFSTLQGMGVLFAIDDFGTGHSSLAYLQKFHIDYLKIDQSFVANIGTDALSAHLLDSIIELSGKLDMGVVAEGVETAEQRDYLNNKGVPLLQGYLFARPMPLEEFKQRIASIDPQQPAVSLDRPRSHNPTV